MLLNGRQSSKIKSRKSWKLLNRKNLHIYSMLSGMSPQNLWYSTDHAQHRICSHLWVCSRLNNFWGGRGTCFACESTSLSVLHDISKQNRCHGFFGRLFGRLLCHKQIHECDIARDLYHSSYDVYHISQQVGYSFRLTFWNNSCIYSRALSPDFISMVRRPCPQEICSLSSEKSHMSGSISSFSH